MDQAVRLVARLDQLTEALVLLGVRLGVAHHALDLILGESTRGLDDDLLLLAGGLVPGRDIEDAVGVDVERHLDLRHAARGRRDVRQIELTEGLVVRGPVALALQHVNGHGGLVVVGGREGVRRLGRDGGVLLDELGHDATERLDAERQRGDIEQQHVLHLARQHARLDAGADRDRLVGVDVLARLLAEEVLHVLLHQRHARLAAHQDHLGHIRRGKAGVLHGGAARTHGLLHQVLHQGLELGARQLDVEMLRSRGIGGDVRQVDVGLLGRGQLDLRLLGGLLQALHGERVLAHIDAGLLLELLGQEIDDAQVEVLAAEEGIPVGRQHFELPLAVDFRDLDDGDVEGAAAQVVHGDLAIAPLLVEPVGERRSGRLVDDALDRQARDAAGVLGRLALRIVEVGRHGDDRFAHRLTEIVLGGLLHLHEHARGDLRRRHLLALHLDPGVAVVRTGDLVGDHGDVPPDHLVLELAADEALDGEQGVVGIGHCLALGRLAHQHLAVLGKGDDGGGGAIALAVLDHPGLAPLHDGHARVGRAEVDTDYLCHGFTPRNLCHKRDARASS